MAKAAPPQPRIPPAALTTGEVSIAIRRWVDAHEDLGRKSVIYEEVRHLDFDTVARTWQSLTRARLWEQDRWHDLQEVFPPTRSAACTLGDVTVYWSPIDRSGLSLVAERDGLVIRR